MRRHDQPLSHLHLQGLEESVVFEEQERMKRFGGCAGGREEANSDVEFKVADIAVFDNILFAFGPD